MDVGAVPRAGEFAPGGLHILAFKDDKHGPTRLQRHREAQRGTQMHTDARGQHKWPSAWNCGSVGRLAICTHCAKRQLVTAVLNRSLELVVALLGDLTIKRQTEGGRQRDRDGDGDKGGEMDLMDHQRGDVPVKKAHLHSGFPALWCAAEAVKALPHAGFGGIIVNCSGHSTGL